MTFYQITLPKRWTIGTFDVSEKIALARVMLLFETSDVRRVRAMY
jgi:hypothetical protein